MLEIFLIFNTYFVYSRFSVYASVCSARDGKEPIAILMKQ